MAAEQVGHGHGRITVHYHEYPSMYKELYVLKWSGFYGVQTVLRASSTEP